jgi:putative oxidoreductase
MTSPSRGWHIGLWVLQVLLGAAFIMSGGMKLATPIAELVKAGMTWAESMPWLPRFIGASEFAGGLGLIVPAATRIKPFLTPLAAALLCLVMVLAAGYHVVNGDTIGHTMPSVVLGALCAFVAYGRFKRAPVAAR